MLLFNRRKQGLDRLSNLANMLKVTSKARFQTRI